MILLLSDKVFPNKSTSSEILLLSDKVFPNKSISSDILLLSDVVFARNVVDFTYQVKYSLMNQHLVK